MSVLLVQVDVIRIVTTLLVDIPVHVIVDTLLKVTDTVVQVGIVCTSIHIYNQIIVLQLTFKIYVLVPLHQHPLWRYRVHW